MDWMQFVAAMTSSLAWPIAAIVLGLAIRGPLIGLLPKIRSLKYGDLQIDLEQQLREVEADLTESTAAILPAPPSEEAVELATISPDVAMLQSWFEVEIALNSLMLRLGWKMAPQHNRSIHKMWLLRERRLIDELTYSTFVRLLKIRNQVAHVKGMPVNQDDALSMSSSCAWLVEQLESVSTSADTGDAPSGTV